MTPHPTPDAEPCDMERNDVQPMRPPTPNLDKTTAESRAAFRAWRDEPCGTRRFYDLRTAFETVCEFVPTLQGADAFETHYQARLELDASHEEALKMNRAMSQPEWFLSAPNRDLTTERTRAAYKALTDAYVAASGPLTCDGTFRMALNQFAHTCEAECVPMAAGVHFWIHEAVAREELASHPDRLTRLRADLGCPRHPDHQAMTREEEYEETARRG